MHGIGLTEGRGVNPHIQAHVTAIPVEEHLRLKGLNATPAGLLQISDELEPDESEGSQPTYMHGVAITDDSPPPEDLDSIAVPAGNWAVFTTDGPHPQALQETWAATAGEWFPSNAHDDPGSTATGGPRHAGPHG